MYQFRTSIGPPNIPPERFPEDDPDDSEESPAVQAARDKVIMWMLIYVGTSLLLPWVYVIWMIVQTGQVEASRPIGHFVSMSASDRFLWPLVIETEEGFFPLAEAVSIAKGTPLMLEDRASGKRFICNQQRAYCVRTSSGSMSPSVPAESPAP